MHDLSRGQNPGFVEVTRILVTPRNVCTQTSKKQIIMPAHPCFNVTKIEQPLYYCVPVEREQICI